MPRSITVGSGLPLTAPVSQSVGVRLRSGGLDGLEPLIEAELANLDYNAIVTSIGTINAVNDAVTIPAVAVGQRFSPWNEDHAKRITLSNGGKTAKHNGVCT